MEFKPPSRSANAKRRGQGASHEQRKSEISAVGLPVAGVPDIASAGNQITRRGRKALGNRERDSRSKDGRPHVALGQQVSVGGGSGRTKSCQARTEPQVHLCPQFRIRQGECLFLNRSRFPAIAIWPSRMVARCWRP